MLKSVRMTAGQREVKCPFCGAVLKWDEELEAFDPLTICSHLDKEDYITSVSPFSDEYDVWFRDEENTRECYMLPVVVIPLREKCKVSPGDTLVLADGRKVHVQAIYPVYEVGKALVWVFGKQAPEGWIRVEE